MKYILGIVGTKTYNLETKEEEYQQSIVVEEAVIDWLDKHDLEIGSKGEKFYICNNIKYQNLGPEIIIDFKSLTKSHIVK